jgi:hypothetical protein
MWFVGDFVETVVLCSVPPLYSHFVSGIYTGLVAFRGSACVCSIIWVYN